MISLDERNLAGSQRAFEEAKNFERIEEDSGSGVLGQETRSSQTRRASITVLTRKISEEEDIETVEYPMMKTFLLSARFRVLLM